MLKGKKITGWMGSETQRVECEFQFVNVGFFSVINDDLVGNLKFLNDGWES